jgi:mevalonate kinase
MPAISYKAPGKIILFGEHAVVYGRPAIAVPVSQVQARAMVTVNPTKEPGEIQIQAPDIGLQAKLKELPQNHPLAVIIEQVASALQISRLPAFTLRITSTIPVSAGMGSGAAVSVAAIRALSAFLGHLLPDEQVSDLTFEIEKLHHGTPSGIDNTVISYAKPVFYAPGSGEENKMETFQVTQPFIMVIGDTGIPSPTSTSVGLVRQAWQADKEHFERIFDEIGNIVRTAHQAIKAGRPDDLGSLMNYNQALLQEIGVSSPELESLIQAALSGGAQGAKLSGGGRGGNMIALVSTESAERVTQSIREAGATRIITTTVV